MAEDRREQELRAAAKQLAGVQRQHRPDQTAAARSQAGQKAQPQRAAKQATAQRAAAQSQVGQKAQPQRAAQQATTQTANSNGSGKALSGQQIQQMRTTNTPAKESMSQTKQIPTSVGTRSRRYYGCRILCGSRLYRSGSVAGNVQEGRRSYRFFAKRNKDKETDAATKAQTPQEKDKETVVSAGHTGYKETAVDKTTEQPQESDKQEEQIEKLQKWGRIGQWFQTFCWMHIPIFGFWYMVVLAVRKRTPEEKKTFARAYVLYRVLVMLLALTILYVFYRMGLSFVEQILAYIDMHS